MPRVIDAIEVTADWLTAVLWREGMLPRGRVEAVTIEANAAFNSTVSHLEVDYTADAPAGAPRQLVLKRSLPVPWAREAGRSEVAFYGLARGRAEELPMVVPCYDAAYDPRTGDSHLLLLDLSPSHAPPVTREGLIGLRGVPPDGQLAAAVDAVAALHAAWWESPELGTGTLLLSSWYASREQFEVHVRRRREEWARFTDAEAHWLPAEIRDLYESALERLPVLWARFLAGRVGSHRNLTLVHGDCYLSQFLCPRHGTGTTYLIDFQGAYADFPTVDLVHLFATFWTPEQRREENRERRMLRRYLSALHARGVTGYSWGELETDYRLLLILMILYPVWDATNGSPHSYWGPKLQCLTAAYRDWDCAALLV